MKILVGYDGSTLADAAIEDLRRAGLPARDVEVVVLSVADVWPSSSEKLDSTSVSYIARNAHELARHALDEAERFAGVGAERLRNIFPQWSIRSRCAAGSPAGTIVAEAEKWGADLIVVGALGCSMIARAVLGSIARDVVRHAHCSVRIGRANPRAAGSNQAVHLVLGIDGSPSAATAVSAVAARHWPANSTVHVVTALDVRITTALAFAPPEQPFAPMLPVEELTDNEWARDAVEAVARELRASNLTPITIVHAGDPRAVILNEAQKCDADCIFVGAKGMSRVERFLLGSVSEHVARRATCSVEVVRFPVT